MRFPLRCTLPLLQSVTQLQLGTDPTDKQREVHTTFWRVLNVYDGLPNTFAVFIKRRLWLRHLRRHMDFPDEHMNHLLSAYGLKLHASESVHPNELYTTMDSQ